MNENKIIMVVGIAFIPLGLLMSIFSRQFTNVFSKIAKFTWKDIPPKSEFLKDMKESVKEKYKNPEEITRGFKYVIGPSMIVSGIVIILVAILLSKYGQ